MKTAALWVSTLGTLPAAATVAICLGGLGVHWLVSLVGFGLVFAGGLAAAMRLEGVSP